MGVDVLTGSDDHVRAAAQDVELALVEVPLVPHREPAVEGPQRLAVVAPQVPVADHAAADTDVSGHPFGKDLAGVVQDPDLDARERPSNAGAAGIKGLAGRQAGAR